MSIRHYLFLALLKTIFELKSEVSRGFLGMAWWVIEPVLYMGAFYLTFGVLFSRGENDYVSFLLSGLVVWKWFASSVALGSNSLMANHGIMRLVYVPKYIFPLVSVLTGTVKFLVIFVLLLLYLIIVGHVPNYNWFWLPLLLIIQFFLSLGISGVLSALTPFFPDLRGLIENALMLLFFLSGVFFDINTIVGKNADLLFFNPMAVLISSYRGILISTSFNPEQLIYPAVIAALFLSFSVYLLVRFDRMYPKVIR